MPEAPNFNCSEIIILTCWSGGFLWRGIGVVAELDVAAESFRKDLKRLAKTKKTKTKKAKTKKG